MRFFRRNVPNKASAALRIPHKGTSTEQRGCPRCKTRLESDHAVFRRFRAGQIYCRTPYSALLPRGVFRAREHPQSSGGARGGKARLESNYAVFQAQCAEQSFCRAPYSTQGNIHRAAGVPEGARPASNWILRFSPAQCAEQSFYRAPYFTAREHPQSSGGARGARPASNQIMRFFRRIAPEKPPRSYGNGGCNTHMTARC